MTVDFDVPQESRWLQLIGHLGIKRAHFAGGAEADYRGLVAASPEVFASLTLFRLQTPDLFRPLESHLLVISGGDGPYASINLPRLGRLPAARRALLKNYFHAVWSDVIAERTEEVGAALDGFLSEMTRHQQLDPVPLPAQDGVVADISYQVRGSGPPLFLLPVGLGQSQWEPLLPDLSQRYTTIVLGGPTLGIAFLLEGRGASPGYRRCFAQLVDGLGLKPDTRVLDVGCGTGVLDRWLVQRPDPPASLVALDVNRFLLREAAALARREAVDHLIEFREGDAEALPFPDNSFDATFSVTVMEEVDAEHMLAELVRVTRPGGRVGVIVRAEDMRSLVNLPHSPDLKAKAEAPGGGAGQAERGCADASLYRRFREAGLLDLQMTPQYAIHASGPYLAGQEIGMRARFGPDELAELDMAVAEAKAQGTFFIANPQHLAIGTKP